MTSGTDRRPTSLFRWAVAAWGVALLFSSVSCATFDKQGTPLVPTRYQVRTGPFLLFSNFPMEDDPPAVRCLLALSEISSGISTFSPMPRTTRSRSMFSTIATHLSIFSSSTIQSCRRGVRSSWPRAIIASSTLI